MRLSTIAAATTILLISLTGVTRAENFSLQDWNRIEAQAARGDPRATGLRDGFLHTLLMGLRHRHLNQLDIEAS